MLCVPIIFCGINMTYLQNTTAQIAKHFEYAPKWPFKRITTETIASVCCLELNVSEK